MTLGYGLYQASTRPEPGRFVFILLLIISLGVICGWRDRRRLQAELGPIRRKLEAQLAGIDENGIPAEPSSSRRELFLYLLTIFATVTSASTLALTRHIISVELRTKGVLLGATAAVLLLGCLVLARRLHEKYGWGTRPLILLGALAVCAVALLITYLISGQPAQIIAEILIGFTAVCLCAAIVLSVRDYWRNT
jgi:hypothetical protein